MRHPVPSFIFAWLTIWALSGHYVQGGIVRLSNVSSDNARSFYQEYNLAFAAYWKEKTGQSVVINQSFGDSSAQSQSITSGFDADVVTLDKPVDVDSLYQNGCFVSANWAERLPDKSVPFTSTIVFLVRKSNPKDIRNWDDLIRSDVRVVTPSPKTSDVGRYNYLAAWGYALKKSAGDEKQARLFVARLFGNVPILDAGGEGAETTFATWGIGDALLTYENEAALIQKKFPKDDFEVVLPPVSIVTQNVATWLDHEVEHHNNEAVARAYLDYLYSDEGQELAAQHFFRPGNETILARYSARYKPLQLLTVDDIVGGWPKAQQVHFADGGIFDQIHHRYNFP
jgi:sulfate/thiosulfate-binding protein